MLTESLSQGMPTDVCIYCLGTRSAFPGKLVKAENVEDHFPMKGIGEVAQAAEKSAK